MRYYLNRDRVYLNISQFYLDIYFKIISYSPNAIPKK